MKSLILIIIPEGIDSILHLWCKCFKQSSIRVGESREHLYILFAVEMWPFQSILDCIQSHFNSLQRYDEPMTFNLRCMSYTLDYCNCEVVFLYSSEYLPNCFGMSFLSFWINQVIFHIDEKSTIEHVCDNCVHGMLQCSWGICKTKSVTAQLMSNEGVCSKE